MEANSNLVQSWLGRNYVLVFDMQRIRQDAHLLVESGNFTEALQTVSSLAQQGMFMGDSYYRILDKTKWIESLAKE